MPGTTALPLACVRGAVGPRQIEICRDRNAGAQQARAGGADRVCLGVAARQTRQLSCRSDPARLGGFVVRLSYPAHADDFDAIANPLEFNVLKVERLRKRGSCYRFGFSARNANFIRLSCTFAGCKTGCLAQSPRVPGIPCGPIGPASPRWPFGPLACPSFEAIVLPTSVRSSAENSPSARPTICITNSCSAAISWAT